jgi:hypothetical protein
MLMKGGLILLGLAIALVGCQTNTDVSNSDILTPVINPHPKHLVRIVGRIPKSLEIEFGSGYAISDSKKNIPGCWPTVEQQWGSMGIDKFSRGEDLKIIRDGERFEANFMVDKYLPGDCGWGFYAVGVTVAKDGRRDEKATVDTDPIRVNPVYENENQGLCSSDYDVSCPNVSNSDPTPVIIRCYMFTPKDEPDRTPSILCGGYEHFGFKRTHYVTPETRKIQINFYDLELEADPLAEQKKQTRE